MRSDIPHLPGCYLFRQKGKIIYIGKAKDLKKRVSSYFKKKDHDAKTQLLVEQADDVDFIVTQNEIEALILENNLIKKNQPHFNINLKDAKRYAYLQRTEEDFPRLLLARKRTKGKFFGPFVSGAERDQIRKLCLRMFKLRTCKRMPKKACLRHHINLCTAPCIGNVTKEQYAKQVRKAELLLSGHTSELMREMGQEMKQAAAEQNFEHAMLLRDQLQALEYLSEKQNMERQKKFDEDIINYKLFEDRVYMMLFNIHRGTLINKQEFDFRFNPDFLEEFIVQYYSEHDVPKEIIVPDAVDNSVTRFLEQRRKTKVKVAVPKIGDKRKLLDLVQKNIEISFFGDITKLEELQKKLRLNDLPVIIETFDISHLQGTGMVGSMVQFRNAKPDKSNYRRFRIKTVENIDDFASIAEVVRRRYSRLKQENAEMPNLVVIDGGKGQLSAALRELERLYLKIPIISIAKRDEEIFFPYSRFPLKLDKKEKALQFIQEMRDEAHRFAISYNRLLRKKDIK